MLARFSMTTDAAPPEPMMFCPRCRAESPRAACREVALGDERARLCPGCGMVTRPAQSRLHARMSELFVAALRRPLTGEGWRVWAALVVTMSVLSWLGALGSLFGEALAAMYLFGVLQRSARGEPAMPDALDVESVFELRHAWGRLFVAGLVVAGPWLVAGVVEGAARWPAVALASAWFAFATPGVMALAAYAPSSWHVLRVSTVFQMASRIPRDYAALSAMCLAMMTLTTLGGGALGLLASALSGVPVVSFALDVAARTAALYPLLAMACLVGEVLHDRRHALGWSGT